jgi:hypothetical protein
LCIRGPLAARNDEERLLLENPHEKVHEINRQVEVKDDTGQCQKKKPENSHAANNFQA